MRNIEVWSRQAETTMPVSSCAQCWCCLSWPTQANWKMSRLHTAAPAESFTTVCIKERLRRYKASPFTQPSAAYYQVAFSSGHVKASVGRNHVKIRTLKTSSTPIAMTSWVAHGHWLSEAAHVSRLREEGLEGQREYTTGQTNSELICHMGSIVLMYPWITYAIWGSTVRLKGVRILGNQGSGCTVDKIYGN